MPVHDPKALPRVKLHYHTAFGAHTLTYHIQATSDPAVAASTATVMANGLKGLLRSTGEAFDSVEFILAGTNVGNFVTWTPIAGTTAVGTAAGGSIMEVIFPGRTSTGTRARLIMFSSFLTNEANMRSELGESAIIDAVINFIRGGTFPANAADGLPIVWKPYANITPNRHYLRAARKLGG